MLGLDGERSDSNKEATRARSPSPLSLSPPPLSSVWEKQRQEEVDEEEGAAAHSDVLVIGLERLPAPGIEQIFEVNADPYDDSRAHTAARAPNYSVRNGSRLLKLDARLLWTSSHCLARDCRCLRSTTKTIRSALGPKGRSGGATLEGMLCRNSRTSFERCSRHCRSFHRHKRS